MKGLKASKKVEKARWNLAIDRELYKEIKKVAIERDKRANKMLEELVKLGLKVLKEREGERREGEVIE